jgi:hypothetical protein
MPHQQYQTSIDAAIHCARNCEHCADEYLGSMPECARLCRDCAQICWTIAGFMSRSSRRFIPNVVRACIDICEACEARMRTAR